MTHIAVGAGIILELYSDSYMGVITMMIITLQFSSQILASPVWGVWIGGHYVRYRHRDVVYEEHIEHKNQGG